ncbi:MAG: hypothetical protein HBSAPP03_26450 [Phycisphaerae bacterium]|nr:MAG: hypothetical protein HBSAPP03_26450 [Phycisphaerae bacterium]
MTTIVLEGWRFLPHSYALWAMYLALEWGVQTDRRVYFRDAPFADASWRPARGVLSEAQEAMIAALPAPPAGVMADLHVRITFPYDFSPSDAARTIVLGTTEYGFVPPTFMKGGEPISAAAARSGFTIGTPTKWSMDGFLRSGVKRTQMFLAPNGIDPAVFRPAAEEERAALRRDLGWDGHFVLLHNSNLGWNKNLEGILYGLGRVAEVEPNVHLVIKGVDALYPSAKVMERMSAFPDATLAERVLPRVSYVGESMSMEHVARFYKAADAYVCPYLAEGFNMPALEAAACGLPVICTKGGSTDDFVTDAFALRVASTVTADQATGGRVLMPNIEHYVEQLRRVVKDGAFRARARVAGPAHAHGGWMWSHAADKVLRAAGLA